jgi:hypothetical protein
MPSNERLPLKRRWTYQSRPLNHFCCRSGCKVKRLSATSSGPEDTKPTTHVEHPYRSARAPPTSSPLRLVNHQCLGSRPGRPSATRSSTPRIPAGDIPTCVAICLIEYRCFRSFTTSSSRCAPVKPEVSNLDQCVRSVITQIIGRDQGICRDPIAVTEESCVSAALGPRNHHSKGRNRIGRPPNPSGDGKQIAEVGEGGGSRAIALMLSSPGRLCRARFRNILCTSLFDATLGSYRCKRAVESME